MSLFDSASLVVTPNGYKEDKLYSIKPTDGSGDLVVTRATTATRVNSEGLIEQVPYNFLQQSQTFDDAAWNKLVDGQVIITANSTIAPDGTNTADKIIPSAISGFHCVQQQITLSNTTASVSIYAKASENSFLQIFDALTTDYVNFNLTTGTVGSSDEYVGNIENVGNGWYRCIATKAFPSGNLNVRFSVVTSSTATRGQSFTGNGTSGLFIWGAQLVSGISAKEYFPTTDRLNVPRLDYTNSSCPSILVEPQRTNVLLRSEEYDNASWIKINTTISANVVNSPNGTQSADKVIEDSANGQKYILQQYITAATGFYTFSSYIKADGRNFVRYGMTDGISDAYVDVNLTTKATANLTTGGAWSGGSVSVTDAANGFLRISFTASKGAGASIFPIIFLCNTLGNSSYLGNGTSGVYLWGAQLEAGSYPTSYIPTVASSVTRNADVISKTGISDLIGQTEGTIFVDVILGNENAEMYLILQNILGNVIEDSIYIQRNTNELKFVGWDGYDLNWNISGGSFITGQRVKIAAAYKANDIVLYVNGTQIGADSVASIPPTTSLALGYFPYTPSSEAERAKNIKSVSIWKERLSNETLAQLTTI